MNNDRAEKLSQIYKKINALDDEIPLELMEKMMLYGQALEIIGRLHAEAVRNWKLAEAKRRETIAESIIYAKTKFKTTKEKEAAAEVVGAEARRKEAIAEAESQRWKNAYQSTLEIINILKKKYEHLKEVANGGI